MNFALFRIRKRHFFFMSETSEKIQINIFHYETYNTLRQFLILILVRRKVGYLYDYYPWGGSNT